MKKNGRVKSFDSSFALVRLFTVDPKEKSGYGDGKVVVGARYKGKGERQGKIHGTLYT